MASDTIGCHRFFNVHRLVAFHTLAMVSRHESRLERIPLIEGPAVATGATGRLFGRRAIMVAALTERALVFMKVPGQFVIFNVAGQRLDNFAMRQLYRPVLVHQGLHLDIFRYIRLGKGMGYGVAGIKHPGNQIFLFGILNALGNPGHIPHMTGLTGIGILLPRPGNTGMTAGTFGVTLVQIMTAQTAHIYIAAVH